MAGGATITVQAGMDGAPSSWTTTSQGAPKTPAAAALSFDSPSANPAAGVAPAAAPKSALDAFGLVSALTSAIAPAAPAAPAAAAAAPSGMADVLGALTGLGGAPAPATPLHPMPAADPMNLLEQKKDEDLLFN